MLLADFLWCHQESNRGHKDFQSFALPTELWHLVANFEGWWCHQESNRGHKDFQSFALPTELWHHYPFCLASAKVGFFFEMPKYSSTFFDFYLKLVFLQC